MCVSCRHDSGSVEILSIAIAGQSDEGVYRKLTHSLVRSPSQVPLKGPIEVQSEEGNSRCVCVACRSFTIDYKDR